jgi:FkbM family methyltransferase
MNVYRLRGRELGVEVGGKRVAPAGVIHVGGHHGEEADYYDAHGARTVAWIEAEPDAFEVLHSRVAHRPGHHCIQALATDRDGEERSFYRHRFPGGHKRGFCSTLPWDAGAVARDPLLARLETFDVRSMRSITVASALRERALAPSEFQYLSLNVQGAELLVLRGMREYLDPIRWIFCDGEPEGASRYAGAPTTVEVTEWLRPRGFLPAGPASSRLQFFYRVSDAAGRP